MKKIIGFWMIFLINLLLLQGCAGIQADMGEIIVPPQNKMMPIKGTWKIEKLQRIGGEDGESNDLLGKRAVFSEEIALLGDEVCGKPEYKIKNVNTKNYFLYAYQMDYKDLGILDKRINVFSITSNGKHFYDLIQAGDQQLIGYKDHVFFYLKRISHKADVIMGGKNRDQESISKKENMAGEPNLLRSGVLLGLRATGEKQEGIPEDSYRTLWIASKNRTLYPIEEMPYLFVPRKSGFWIAGIERRKEGEYIRDYLFAYPFGRKTEKKAGREVEGKGELGGVSKGQGNLFKSIRFVGNDYAAVECWESLKQGEKGPGSLQVVPMDHIEKDIGIHISEIAGEEGKNILINSAQAYLSNLDSSEGGKLENLIREDHFTLARRNGHWIMKGRLYFRAPQSPDTFVEYSINMIPPAKIVNYDELHVSWNKIKEKVPEALDAYTSPNKDLAIVITQNTLYVYELRNGDLWGKYLDKIKLLEGETVVMAEWATGNYMEKWAMLIKDRVSSGENSVFVP